MGRVFLGWSTGGRPVAVKVIKPELAADAEFRNRFRREVEAARTVSGLYTALLFDADLDGPTPWLATAYVDGPSLAEAVTSYGPLPPESVRALAAGLAEALAAIHTAGLVHRDLKPSNVLLASDGPRVIDFGISRAADTTTLTNTGQSLGSPGYLSPEQAVGTEIGPPTDIFSLGAVLAFAASGNGPFGAGSLPALVYRVVHESPTLEGVPDELRPLLERCLAKEPGDRPTAGDLLADLSDVQFGAQWLPERITSGLAAFAAPTPPQPMAGDPHQAAAPEAPAPEAAMPVVAASGDAAFEPTATSIASAARTPSVVTPVTEKPRPTDPSRSRLLRRNLLVPVLSAAAVLAAVGTVLATTMSGTPTISPLAASGRPLTSAGQTLSPSPSSPPAPRTSSTQGPVPTQGGNPPTQQAPFQVAPAQAAPTYPAATHAAPPQAAPRAPAPVTTTQVVTDPPPAPQAPAPVSTPQGAPDPPLAPRVPAPVTTTPVVTDPVITTPPPPAPKPTLTPISRITWAGAADYACGSQGSVRSAGTTPATLSVTDNTSYPIELFWINASGSSVLYATIGAGGSFNQATYIGHFWMVTNTAGTCEGIVSVGAAASSVIMS